MKQAIILAAIILGCGLASADPRADSQFIVEETITEELFEAAVDSVAPLLAGAVKGELAQEGIVLSDAASTTLADMFGDKMVAFMTDEVRKGAVEVYLETLSPEALAGFRAFLETPAGQEYADQLPAITLASQTLGGEIGARVGGPAMISVRADIQGGRLPEGTSTSVERELKAAFE